MGGALGININHDLIIERCIFENNKAGNKGGAIYVWGRIVKPSDNSNAPEFSGSLLMNLISITESEFIGNEGGEGASIYIEEENIVNTKLHISGCNFTNNGEEVMEVEFCLEKIQIRKNMILQ